MLWFQPLPWGRWALVALVAVLSVYVEFRPDPTVHAPYATAAIAPGEVVDESNAEMRRVPAGLLASAELGSVAVRPVDPGDPILSSDTGTAGATVPPGWWVVGVTLPDGARPGLPVRLVLLDSGEEVDGVVAHPGSDDPFAAADGGVAVAPEHSAPVAVAAANGRLVVLISTG